MKKMLLAALFIMGLTTPAVAQHYHMVVKQKDGKTFRIRTDSVKKVTFTAGASAQTSKVSTNKNVQAKAQTKVRANEKASKGANKGRTFSQVVVANQRNRRA
ncbi:hypothetical protein HMPREF9332_01446 [Alloprevotella rava F0323]|uniref:Uncharacterized protein n=1 Tax=Alloprevotella rava F0323 TaxID=679199 RepID=G5GCZ2_9BACT|nr:hypothetical protein [Alloprevotella rava]EHG22436.1 hypothetical protein HMPREF9332_01446 [Alloprevotella rava F0323]